MAQAETSKHHLRFVLVAWAIASVIGIALSVLIMKAILRPAASPQMADQNLTIVVFTAIAVPVAFFVLTFVGYSLWRFRTQGMPTEDGPPIRSNRLALILWPSVSAGLCVFLLVWGLYGMTKVGTFGTPVGQGGMFGGTRSDPLVVDVTGQQWLWTFTYPSEGGIETTKLVLPVNRQVEFRVTSLDVVHSFWIRAFGVKIDAVPGQVLYTNTTPTQLGTFTARCVELCGLYHAYMQNQVDVVTPASFTAWVQSQAVPAHAGVGA